MWWVERWPPPETMPVRQVYGIVFHRPTGAVVVRDDDGRYNLPGGTPEPTDAGLTATLQRECYEESQLVLADWRPVGYQLVCEDEEFAQCRYAAVLQHADPATADPCTGRTYGRVLVSPADAAGLLGWGDHGAAQLAAATATATAVWGIAPAPAGWPHQNLV